MPEDVGLWRSAQALRRQIHCLPWASYEVRLIHAQQHRAYPGLRHWTATQLLAPATLRFLRLRNRQDYDIYFRPYAPDANAGYILLDLDHPCPQILAHLRAHGHAPSALLQTSPGHLQAWIRISPQPLPLACATTIARHLAQCYGADRASAQGRHLGRLAGFTNRKPQRRQPNGWPPWVQLLYARACLAGGGAALIADAIAAPRAITALPLDAPSPGGRLPVCTLPNPYQTCLRQLRILQRYPAPDWSIVDKWIARQLLQSGWPPARVAAVLRQGSPGFPRQHGDPEDYLRRTLYCASQPSSHSPFSSHHLAP